jgi:hypothetical protein
MATSKPRGTDDEICVLIRLRREHAWKAMSKIVHGLARVPHSMPTVATLLDYLSNMAYTLELMLKLLSGDWRSHNVNGMYETVFGRPHPDSDFMTCLKLALTNQKYLFEPVSDSAQHDGKTIAHYIPEMESLFDDLRQKMWHQHRTYFVMKEFNLPMRFGEFLRDNVARFFEGETCHGNVTPEILQQARERYRRQLDAAALTIDEYLQMAKSVAVAQGTGAAIENLR